MNIPGDVPQLYMYGGGHDFDGSARRRAEQEDSRRSFTGGMESAICYPITLNPCLVNYNRSKKLATRSKVACVECVSSPFIVMSSNLAFLSNLACPLTTLGIGCFVASGCTFTYGACSYCCTSEASNGGDVSEQQSDDEEQEQGPSAVTEQPTGSNTQQSKSKTDESTHSPSPLIEQPRAGNLATSRQASV